MEYSNMADLLRRDPLSREFFYTLPHGLQITMQPYADLVQNADGLHRALELAKIQRRRSEITGDTEPYL